MAVNDVLLDQGGAVHNVRNSIIGTAGNGSTDDAAKFYGLTAGRHYVVPAGTYRFASSGTIPAGIVLELMKGALLKPDTGATVTVAGAVIAGEYQWMDFSAGGSFSFFGNKYIQTYPAYWFGLVADGVVDDQPTLTRLVSSVPDYVKVLVPGNATIRLNSTWVVTNRENITFTTELDPRQGGTNGVTKIKWGNTTTLPSISSITRSGSTATVTFASAHGLSTGAYICISGANQREYNSTHPVTVTGATTVTYQIWEGTPPTPATGPVVAGWSMIFLDRCRFFVLDGFNLGDSGNADVVVEMDGFGSGIGTQSTVSHNIFSNTQRRTTWVGVRIAESVYNNQEYHYVVSNTFNGTDQLEHPRLYNLSITAGTPNLVASSPSFNSTMVGKRFRGAKMGPAGGLLETTILAFIDSTHVTLTANASTTVSANGYGIIHEAIGQGIRIGNSANAKRIRVADNSLSGCKYGVYCGGSYHAWGNSFTSNEVNFFCNSLADASYDEGSNSEYSRQHIVFVAAADNPYEIRLGRFDVGACHPNKPYIELLNGPATLEVSGCGAENGLPVNGGCVHYSRGLNNSTKHRGWRFQVPPTLAEFGITEFDGNHVTLENNRYLPGVAGFHQNRGGMTILESDRDGSIVGKTRTDGSTEWGSFGHCAGVRGEATSGPAAGFNHVAVGVQGAVGRDGQNFASRRYYAFEAQLPKGVSGSSYLDRVNGLRILSPDFSAGGTANACSAIVIEPMAGTGVSNPKGIDQQGTGDVNTLNGPTIHGSMVTEKRIALTDGGTVTPDWLLGNYYTLDAGGSRNFANGNNATDGQTVDVKIRNTTAGAIMTSFGSEYLFTNGAWADPGAGFSKLVRFRRDGALAKWVEVSRTAGF
jgi:hypothetical protein